MSTLDDKQKQHVLEQMYYDPAKGLYNASKLYPKLKHLGLKLQEIKDYIAKQKTGQIHRRPTAKNYYPITAPNFSYQADLIFYPKTKTINNGCDTALTLIEITSRRGYCIPMKGKKTESVLRAMETFLGIDGVEIKNLTTDKGSEFISKSWKELMKKHDISHWTADEGDHRKMGMIERFNRTIKALISKYQTAYKTKKWIDVLDDLLDNYNRTVHSSTGYAPADVGPRERALIRLEAVTKTHMLDQRKDLNVGDKVRLLLRKKNVFGKEGPVWSETVHEIVDDKVKSFKVDGVDRRYKYYELLKVGIPAEENPFSRKIKSEECKSGR
jgi:hypothetical protein